MTSSPVLLLLGHGPRTGAFIAQKFAANGYKVAVTSRRVQDGYTPENYFAITADLAKPETVPSIFERVKSELGVPSVVVYNAAAFEPASKEDPLSVAYPALQSATNVNFGSVYVAAQEAVKHFAQLPDDASKTFIFTGNKLNLIPLPVLTSAAVGKAASAALIQNAAVAYGPAGYRFYYADQRAPNGDPVYGDIDGKAHGEFYYKLASSKSQEPWLATFVKEKGYTEFSTSVV